MLRSEVCGLVYLVWFHQSVLVGQCSSWRLKTLEVPSCDSGAVAPNAALAEQRDVLKYF